MLTQAAGLAVLAAISPTALLVSAVFLGSQSPRRTVLIYLIGALVMTAIVGTVIFVVLRAGHLQLPHHHSSRYGLRLGLGLLMLLVCGWLWRRGERKKDPAKQGKGLIGRMIAKPGPKEAFIVGLLVYGPSLTFVAAVQVVATSKDSVSQSIGALVFVIAITVLFVWLPLVLHLIAPERTSRLLGNFNGWLRSHGHVLAVGALAVGGVVVTINGILGVTGVI